MHQTKDILSDNYVLLNNFSIIFYAGYACNKVALKGPERRRLNNVSCS